MSDIKEPEPLESSKFSFSKNESKLFTIIVKFGPQTNKELILASEMQVERFEEAIGLLQEKGLIKMDDGVYYSVLPVNNILSILESSLDEIESNKENQSEISQNYLHSVQNNLEEFNKSLETQCNELKTSNSLLQASLKDDFESLEQQRVNKTNKLADELLESHSARTSELRTDLQNSFSSKQVAFEKEWTKFIAGFQNIPEAGTHSLKESILKYEKELSDVIKSTTDKIKSIQSQFSDIFIAIESESLTRIQEFFSNAESGTEEFKNNIGTELRESRKHEEEFVNDVREQVQKTLEDEISESLKKVLSNLAKEIDKGINEALKHVVKQTNKSIKESSLQLKTEFKDFAENAALLLQEQRPILDVLGTELSEISSEQKLTSQRELFIKQFQSKLSTELNSLEGNYRLIQKQITEIMENIRRSAKDELIKQSSEFEKLVYTFNEVNEKSINRKDMDISRLLQLSQSVSQYLRNLLISIPASANRHQTTIKDSLENARNEVTKTLKETAVNSVKDITSGLTNSQKKVETLFQETSEENKREIENSIKSLEQLSTTISNLQKTYNEKIESRFEQRAKVMNTELEAVSRNFHKVLNGIQSGFGDISERISSENLTRITDIEASTKASTSLMMNNLEIIFTQNKTQNKEYAKNLEITLEVQLDRVLNVIKDGFSQVQESFNVELEKELKQIDEKNEKQQSDFHSVIESFSNQTTNQLNEFNNNLTTSIDDNKSSINDFISDNQKATNEVINLHKANIVKYQDKGPTDILNFIKQIEAEVSVHNKNLKEAMEELASYYDGLSDSTINEVSGLIRQVQESGDKLTAITNDSLQIITNTTAKTSESVDTYFSESLTNLENQIAVTTGFVTSEVDTAAEIVKNEVEVLKSEMKQTVEGLNAEIKDFVTHQDQEFQTKIPELSEKFKQVFDEVIQKRTELDKELQANIEKDFDKLVTNWSKEIQKAKSTLEGVSKAVDDAIESNLEKFDVIVNTNVEQAIKRIKAIFKFDSSKEDIFGLREIQSKVKQSNKRLKSVISETLQVHIEKFEEKIPEFVTSFEAIHNQTEEDLASHIEDLRDLISSSQTSLTNQIHEYIKGERENLDFTEMATELKDIIRNFTQSTNQEIESLSVDLTDSIKTSIATIDISREEIITLLKDIFPKLIDQDTVLFENLTKFKENEVKSIEELSSNTKKDLVSSLETYNSDLDKGTLDTTAKSAHLVQSLTEKFEKQIDEFQTSSNDLFDQLMTANTLQKESLQELAKIISSTKPEYPIRVVNLPTNDARNDYIKDMIKNAAKQVTIFTSNPTFLSPEDLKSIPSEKRIWIYTSYDFTKKGKKWLSEVGGQVNVNLRKANTKKISGVILVQDNNSALILPDDLGYISLDSKFISYLSEFLNLLKGPSLRRLAKKG